MAFLIASAAESTLFTTPRLMPFESARPIPMMSRVPSSMSSPTMADTFDVPTSRPTRYLSLRAMLTPLSVAFCRADKHAIEPQLEVVDRPHVLANTSLCLLVHLQPFQELRVAEVQLGGFADQEDDGV